MNGVVVARLVDQGQTVAASYSTPNLFTIAQDLSRLKVQVAIDESDIGQVRVGQRAFFTVDSYPEQQFQGVVTEVQLNPVVSQNVVTYNVVMQVDNALRGRPRGIARRPRAPQREPCVGKCPGEPRPAARRDAPGPEGRPGACDRPLHPRRQSGVPGRLCPVPGHDGQLHHHHQLPQGCAARAQQRAAVQSRRLPQGTSRRPRARGRAARTPGSGKGLASAREDHVWVLEQGKPKRLPVKAGISDGQFTEVAGDPAPGGPSRC